MLVLILWQKWWPHATPSYLPPTLPLSPSYLPPSLPSLPSLPPSLPQLSPLVSAVTYSFPARLLLDKCISLAKLHFGLRSTIITGIPMKVPTTALIGCTAGPDGRV